MAWPNICLAYLPTSSTLGFVNDPVNPCRHGAISGRRLAALYGDLATRQSSQPSTAAFVEAFVNATKSAFGVDGVELELIDSLMIRDETFESYSYRQMMDDLPVAYGAVNILVHRGSPDRITHIGMSLVQPPASGFPAETLDAEEAVNVVMNHEAWDYLDDFDSHTVAEHVVLEAKDMKVYRAWRFQGWDEDERYLFYVDAAGGEIVAVENQISAYTGKVKVTGDVELCCHAGRPDWPACCETSSPACCCNESDPAFPCVDQCCGNPGDQSLRSVNLYDVETTLTTNACPSSESDWQPQRLTDENGEYDYSQCSGSNCAGNKASVRLGNDKVQVYCKGLNQGNLVFTFLGGCQDAPNADPQLDFSFVNQGTTCLDYASTAFSHTQYALDWITDLQPNLPMLQEVMEVVLDPLQSVTVHSNLPRSIPKSNPATSFLGVFAQFCR